MMANQTDGIPPTPLPGLEENTAAAFYGFAVGAILFGVTIRQAFQYWTSEGKDPWSRRAIIAAVCLLDTLDFGFGLHMVYSFLLQVSGMADASKSVVWSLKALGTAQTFLIVLVQGFYLSQIWRFSGNRLLSTCIQRALKVFVVIISLYAFAIAVVFLMELAKIKVILSFTAGFEYIVYLGLGSTALIDCLIAATMCVMLYKSGGVTDRGQSVIETLITYFVGTGLLTSLAAILGIVMYVAKPGTLIYLAVELSVTRLYAIAMLALFNTRHSLQRRFELTAHTPSEVKFTDPSDLFTSPSPGRREFLLPRKSNFDTSSTGRRHVHRHLPSDADSHIISLLPSPDSASLSPSKDPFASPLDKVHGRDRYSALPSGGSEGEHKYIPYRGYASGKGGHVRVDSSADGTMSPDEDEFLDDDHKDEDENDPFRSPVLRRDGSIASRQYTV